MAAIETSSVKSHHAYQSITMALSSTFHEWLLICMLFLDAFYSYLITKFAHYCKLQVPCLLCSRLDHVLGNEQLGFYWDLVCGKHKLEISSLVICHMHKKLVDVHGMCEKCLFSFATINKSNAETYRLLVGKLGADADPIPRIKQDPSTGDQKLGDVGMRNCSCCNEPWSLRSRVPKLLQAKSGGSEIADFDMPLPVNGQNICEELKNIEGPYGSRTVAHIGIKGFGILSHIEYEKVKVTSDTESEHPFSDDEDSSTLIRETAELREDFAFQCVQMKPHITLAADVTEQMLIHLDSAPDLSLLDSQEQLDVIGSHGSTSATSTAAIGYGLEELSWLQVKPRDDGSAISMSASFEAVPQTSNDMETAVDESKVRCFDSPETDEVEPTCSEGISEVGGKPVTRCETSKDVNPVIRDTDSQVHNNLELGDAYKLAIGSKARQLSGKLLEQRSSKDSARFSEDLKLLLSQISATRGIELPLYDISPRVSVNADELKAVSSSSIGMQILQRRISLERNESGLSLDGSFVSEIEGENEIDRLKRQVDHDKKLLGSLYKELEEERSASAVAANQAMAMITRLQEEKATFHMEALQCLRMMEEQAEYDVEALQKSNDLLSEKEKEIQDLEAELELYRDKLGDASTLEKKVESTSASVQILQRNSTANNSLSESENERLYIIQCLKKLEKKLDLFSEDGVYSKMLNAKYCGAEGVTINDFKESNSKWGAQESNGKEENVLTMQKDASVFEESPCGVQEGCVPSAVRPDFVMKTNLEYHYGGQCCSGGCRLRDVTALGDAVSNLIGWLEALEADHNYVDHSFKLQKNGDEEINVHSAGILSPHSPVRTIKDCD